MAKKQGTILGMFSGQRVHFCERFFPKMVSRSLSFQPSRVASDLFFCLSFLLACFLALFVAGASASLATTVFNPSLTPFNAFLGICSGLADQEFGAGAFACFLAGSLTGTRLEHDFGHQVGHTREEINHEKRRKPKRTEHQKKVR